MNTPITYGLRAFGAWIDIGHARCIIIAHLKDESDRDGRVGDRADDGLDTVSNPTLADLRTLSWHFSVWFVYFLVVVKEAKCAAFSICIL